MFRTAFRAALATSLALSPLAATAQVGAPPVARASADVGSGASELNGDISPLIAIGLIALIFGGAYLLTDDDGPASP